MKRSLHFLLTSGLLLWSALAYGQPSDHSRLTDPRAPHTMQLGRSPLYFIENHGQVEGPARYYLQGRDRTLFAADNGLTFILESDAKTYQPASTRSAKVTQGAYALRLEFVGARPNASVRGEGTGPVVNLFTGGRENWRTGLPSYSRLVYTDLWPGIDLALIGDTQRVKYEFRVKPGADPKQIRLRYRGADALRIAPSGDLAVDTPLGTLRDQRPFSFQELDGRRAEVKTQYALRARDHEVSFTLASYDRTKPLVIDPAVFVYASYLGGTGSDRGGAIAVDKLGAAYILGDTTSPETSFPTGAGFGSLSGADTTYNGGLDTFVAKVLPSGTGLEYVTYVGGSGDDVASGIAVDSTGCVYAAGYTNSGAQFPVVGGPSTSYNGGAHDVFVFKLNATGTALIYSGFIGGAGDDREPAIAVDDSGSAYVTGLTYSDQTTFPTGSGFGSLPGADQTHNGDADAFVVKLRPDGSGLQYASYIGGSGFDNGYAIGVDGAGNVYVGGNTASHEDTFPNGNGVGAIPGPNTTYAGGAFDAFVVKLNSTGTSFSYLAFVGGSAEDRYVPGMAVDRQGNVWLAGHTVSAEDTFPTGHGFGSIPGFGRTYNGGGDAFVVKINAAGTAFDYATYIGGSGNDEAQAVAVDSDGNAYVTGWTNSTESTFPNGQGFGTIPGPDTTYNGGQHDVFVVKLNAAGTDLIYATYIGGPGGGYYDELGTGIAADESGNAYVTGYTTSSDGFPGGSGFGSLPGFDQTYSGNTDAFVVKISAGTSQPPITVDAGPDQTVAVGTRATLAGTGTCSSGTPLLQWTLVTKATGSAAVLSAINTTHPTFLADVAGSYALQLTAHCGTLIASATTHVTAQKPPYGVDSDTVAYWRFEETAGSTVADETGNNPGVANGTAIGDGKYGKARHYQSNVGDYIRVPDSPTLTNLSQITIEAWVYPASCQWYREEIVEKGSQIEPYNFYNLGAFGCPSNDGTLTFHFEFVNHSQGPTVEAIASSSIRHPILQWYYVVGTYDGVRAKLYVNGVLEVTSLDGPPVTVTTHDPLFIHNHTFQNGQSNGRMGGIIDELRISRVARPESEIAPPVADAGADQNVQVGTTVTLAGSGSCGSGAPQFQWSITGKPPGSAAALSITGTPNPTFFADKSGNYTLQLSVICGHSLANDTMVVTARGCTGDFLQVNPEYPPERKPGKSITFQAFGGGGLYAWELSSNNSNATLSSNTGNNITYRAGASTGTDIVTLTDSVCGNHLQLPILVTTLPRPEVIDVEVTPNPTRGAGTIQVEALLQSEDFDDAEVCIDEEFVRPPGGCHHLQKAVNNIVALGSFGVQTSTSTSGISYGSHVLAIRGHNAAGWGDFSAPKRFYVNLRIAILLLNGYNFCKTGQHPEQWWHFRDIAPDKSAVRTIPCQIRDFFFNNDVPLACPLTGSELPGSGTDCPRDMSGTIHDPVCIVGAPEKQDPLDQGLDGLDGREDIFDDLANGIVGNRTRLETYISKRKWLSDADQLILIGHSYGGLIARAYAAEHPDKVLAIITLDTPHTGTPLADEKAFFEQQVHFDLSCLFHPFNSYDRAIKWLQPSGAAEFNKNVPPTKSPDTVIYTIASEDGFYFLNPDDNVVPVDSQQATGSLAQDQGLSAKQINHDSPLNVEYGSIDPITHKFKGFDFISHDLHNAILEEKSLWDDLFSNQIKPILQKYLNIGPASSPQQARNKNLLSTRPIKLPQQIAQSVISTTGELSASSPSASVSFAVESSTELIVRLVTENANPSAVLTGPGGIQLTAATADGLTMVWNLKQNAQSIEQVILVRNPASGTWNITFGVPAPGGTANLPSSGSSWQLTASVRSPITLQISNSESSLPSDESLAIKASLSLNSVGISGATVNASVTSVSGTPVSIPLLDDGSHGDGAPGDGIYGGTVALPATTDINLSVTAQGPSAIGAFQRQEDSTAILGSATATTVGGFTEAAPDVNGNSLFDSLGWGFNVVLPSGGTYTCSGDLAAADGSIISHSNTSITAVSSGTVPLTIVFPGSDIYRSAKIGPYSLINLRLTVSTPEGERLVGAWLDAAISGGPYWSWLSFERQDGSPVFVWREPVVGEIFTKGTVNLQWTVADGNGPTTLDLYYDTIGSGFAGTPIVTGLDAVNGPMAYSWDISSLPDGVHYVYARIRNGEFSDAVYGGSVHKITDTDGDGMPDSWESAHGLNPNDAADAYLDPDHDSLANVDEYLNGCDPHNADSDGGGEMDGSEVANGRDCSNAADDVTTITLFGVAPNEGDSRGGDTLLVTGSGFQSGATVDFGGTPAASLTFLNSTRLLVQTPAHAVGTTDVTVSNPSGGGSVTKTAAFMFLCQFVESPLAGNNGPLCSGQTLQLTSTGLTGASFSWTGPNGFSSTLQNPTISNAGAAASGTYTVTETVGQCVVQATTTVSIGPAAPAASSNNPVCAGKDLQLIASAIPGATYQWTGPNNYQSTQQNPVIPSVTPASSGLYSVTATVGTCTSTPASIQLAVHAPALSAPQGGETWYKGQTYNIQWSGSGNACDSTVKIEAYKGGVFYGTITSSTADSGSYSWTIPAAYVIGSDYKIKITGNTNSSYTSQSNSNFAIVDPPTCSFVLAAPNGGETWYKGHSYNIAWSSPGGACSANVKIEAYKGDTFYATLASSTSNSGSYSWIVPSSYVDGSDYKIKITDTANATYTNQSSNPFTIGTALSPIFMDGYESGNTSAWSWRLGDGSQGNLANSIRVPSGGSPEGSSLCAAGNPNMARFNQNCGALVNLISGDSTPTYVQDNSPSGEPAYRVRFYINLRTLQMQDGDEFDVFTAYDGSDPVPPATDGNAVLRLVVRQTGGHKRLSAFARLNSGSETEIPAAVVLADGWRSIEIDWAGATAPGAQDGRLGLWVDGTARTGLSGLDNETLTINYSRLGAVAGLDPGTTGTFRTDDFVSQRSGYIGPVYPFADVATTSPFFPFIQGIYAAEIIPACSIGSFCSEGPITRKEMAMFLLLAKYGAGYMPPACSTPMFNDVPCSSPWAPWINEIAREGVTAGCSPGLYCPDGNITRSQMSVFLMVAKGGVTPTACPPSAFSDIPPGSPFCPWIKEIANRGITAGCGGGNFCPESLVLRGQMSVFLSVTFGIPTHSIGP